MRTVALTKESTKDIFGKSVSKEVRTITESLKPQ